MSNQRKKNASQILPTVPGVRHEFVLSALDFNHHQLLGPSSLLKYATDARWFAFAHWPAFSKMMQEDPSADVLVRCQMVRYLKPHRLQPGSKLSVTQTPHAVGTSSVTLAYDFFHGDDQDAFAQILTVCVRVKDGSSLPLPEYVAQDLVWRHRVEEVEGTHDLALLSTAISKTKVPTAALSESKQFSHEVLVRPSDTDRRKIVNNVRMSQFFEDALPGHQTPDVFYFEIMSEIRPKTYCDVVSVPNTDNGGKEIISFLIERETGKTLARSYMSWIAKVLQDGE